jgi:hypothetical protein
MGRQAFKCEQFKGNNERLVTFADDAPLDARADPSLGDWDDAEVIATFGAVPDDLSTLSS